MRKPQLVDELLNIRKCEKPVIIAGVGGSGTRAVCEIFIRSGFFMGSDMNPALDDRSLVPVIDSSANAVLATAGTLNYRLTDLPMSLVTEVREGVDLAVCKFISEIPRHIHSWGWKQPRTIFLLPFLNEILPNFRFIHVIRDGRDIAFSKNKNQIRYGHYQALFGEPAKDQILASMRWWLKVNLDVEDWACQNLGERYQPLRYEDLCDNPADVLGVLANFTESILPREAIQHISLSPNRGRWREVDDATIEKILDTGGPGLAKFEYGSE